MTRALSTCCAVGSLLAALACGSTDDGSSGSGGRGGASSGGSGGQGATGGSGTGGVGTGGVGAGGVGTGGVGTGGAGGTGGSTGGAGGTGGASGSGGTTGGTAGKGGTGGTGATGGASGSGGASGTGGSTGGTGGTAGGKDGGTTGGTGGTTATDAGRDGSADAGSDTAPPPPTDGGASNFSFFVVSMKALQTLSGSVDGFGGDLKFGKADGLTGADEICRQAAEMGMTGAGSKQWRAFLSVTKGPNGTAVNARDRIGAGPWYDRAGRLLAANLTDLFAGARPKGDAAIVNDMPNERGEPNHYVGAGGYNPSMTVDNHDTITGSDTMGNLRAAGGLADTCNDWTSTMVTAKPYVGHSWPRSTSSGLQWASDHTAPGCVPGVDRTLGGTGTGSCIGCSGGYGGFYCFALP
ncbi:MAG: hypothetical protein ABW133_08830 [Polyangiaceae bacterium]